MFYKARVISNEDFASTGKIIVRVFENSIPDNWRNLTKISNTIDNSLEVVKNDSRYYPKWKDTEAYVFSPFGGGYDYGMFTMPQPNSLGVVTTIASDNNKSVLEYIWVGSCTFDNDGYIGIPSSSEKDINGINDGVNESTREGLVIKTKSTNYTSPLRKKVNPNELDFTKKGFTNLIVVDENEIKVYHRDINNNISNGSVDVFNTTCLTLDGDGINGFVKTYKDGFEDEKNQIMFNFDSSGEITLERKKEDEGDVTLTIGSYQGDASGHSKPVASIMQYISTKDYNIQTLMTENEITSEIDGNSITLKGTKKNSDGDIIDNGEIFIQSGKNKNINIVPGENGNINLGSDAGGMSFLMINAKEQGIGGETLDINGTILNISNSVKG